MRIGIDLTSIWRPSTGIFVYAKELTRALLSCDSQNEYTLIFSGEVHPEFRALETKFHTIVLPSRAEVICKQFLMPFRCTGRSLDLIHFPALPPTAFCTCPFLWTLHDATPWLYPSTMELKGRLYYQWLGRWAVGASKSIITVSHEAKKDITNALGVQENKVKVVYEGVDPAFRKLGDPDLSGAVRNRYCLPERFILSVATLEPRKNLQALVRAYRRLVKAGDHKLGLVIVGRVGWKTVIDSAGGSNQEEQIIVTGFVPQADLVALYNLASVFVLPSLYEGFGLTPLEAMACGCPVVVSARGSLPEVVGEAAMLIDPSNEESIVSTIQRVQCDGALRMDLISRGLKRAKKFSWDAAAKETLRVYHGVSTGT